MIKEKRFSLFRNFKHSMDGFSEVFRHEMAMRVEVFAFVGMSIVLIFLPIGLVYKGILFLSLFLPLFAEIVNSAIERAVDLSTQEYHIMAKRAKDAGSAVVLLSLLMTGLIWAFVLSVAFGIV